MENRNDRLREFFCFVAGLFMLIEVNMIGRLYMTEVLLLFVVIFNIDKVLILFSHKLFNFITIFVMIWLLAQIVSDVINQTAMADVLRGWSKIAFLMINAIGIAVLCKTVRQLLAFFIGYYTFVVLNAALGLGPALGGVDFDVRWKFGIGLGLSALIPSVFLYFQDGSTASSGFFKKTRAVLSLLLILSLIFNSRSAAGLIFVTIILLYISINKAANDLFFSIMRKNFMLAIISFLALSYTGLFAYNKAADAGYLGIEAQRKLWMQQLAIDDPVVGTLIGGRTEIFSSSAAIADAPFLGHGSWARDYKYIDIYYQALMKYSPADILIKLSDEQERFEEESQGLIPTHSHLLGAWVEAGVAGALFWACLAVIMLKATIRSLKIDTIESKMLLLIVVGLLWDIAFSPFGAAQRVIWALCIVIICSIQTQKIKQL